MKILITAIGITGKSTLRRRLVKLLRDSGLSVNHYDADEFKEVRDTADKDCLGKLPENFLKDAIYIIEDIHAPLESAILPLKSYDFILYVKTGFFSHLLFWLPRMIIWFNQGKFSWEQETGWMGTGKPYDPRNICPMVKELLNNFRNRKRWIAEDLKIIRSYPHIIVRSIWNWNGPKFKLKI